MATKVNKYPSRAQTGDVKKGNVRKAQRPMPNSTAQSNNKKSQAQAEGVQIDKFSFYSGIAKGAVNVYSNLYEGKRAALEGKSNAAREMNNARIKLREGVADEDKMRADARFKIGAQVANGAESGVALTGSRLDALHDSYLNVEKDASVIRTEARLAAIGHRNSAEAYKQKAKDAKRASYINAFGSAVDTAATSLAAMSPPESGAGSDFIEDYSDKVEGYQKSISSTNYGLSSNRLLQKQKYGTKLNGKKG